MNSIQEVCENTLKLENVFQAAEKGQFFSYAELQEETQIQMDYKGRTYIRSALKRLKLPYETIKGVGITILSKDNAIRIVARDVTKIDRSVRRAEKTTKQVHDKIFDELPKEQQENLKFLGKVFGAIRLYSQSAKSIFKKEPLKIGEKIN